MTVKDEYVRANQNLLGWMGKQYTRHSNGWYQTSYSGNSSTAWVWPTSLELAPGCTMGCGRCAVTVRDSHCLLDRGLKADIVKGSTIDFLFWPSGPTTDGPPVTAVTHGTTLTSPTNYISFSQVWAQDACGNVIGHNITSTIVPVPPTATLSSVWGKPGGMHDAMGYSVVSLFTASFNIDDLMQTPVPYSIYMSQPWCATSRYWKNVHAVWPEVGVGTYRCPMNESYKPIIVAPGEVLAEIDPAFASCSPEVKGFYDPVSRCTIPPGPSECRPPITKPSNSQVPSRGSGLPLLRPLPMSRRRPKQCRRRRRKPRPRSYPRRLHAIRIAPPRNMPAQPLHVRTRSQRLHESRMMMAIRLRAQQRLALAKRPMARTQTRWAVKPQSRSISVM